MAERFTFTSTVRIPDDGEGMYVEIPADVYDALGGKGRIYVTGTLAGAPFHHSVLRYGGKLLMTVPRAPREASGVAEGDVVEVTLERNEELG